LYLRRSALPERIDDPIRKYRSQLRARRKAAAAPLVNVVLIALVWIERRPTSISS
jgi:hypothetical protein